MQQELFQNQKIRRTALDTYNKACDKLNDAQRIAVEQIEGPVMVIAGPGTGKTQILAVRVAKILMETDAHAHNILCLTFTDAATIAMRRRLVEIIGPAAHQVHIYTFHGFCNQVIQENLGLFGDFRKLESITELEKVDVYKEIIDSLSNDHILKRLKGDPSYEAKRLDNLFQMVKKENLSPEQLYERIDDYLERKNDPLQSPEMFYRRNGKGYKVGDRKEKDWDTLNRKMKELRSAVDLYPKYLDIMNRLGRYDYQDMILWVLRAFKEIDHLLPSYQERYQYFLVDEFQDTNGAQKEVLEALISYWTENPNVFVVGDDDQAIYKFQGANLSNIKELREDYHPLTIVLEENYRSSQKILNTAKELIFFNKERIINDDPKLHKNLIASAAVKDYQSDPQIKSYKNIVQEQAAIADMLCQEHKNGNDLKEIAVIYRKHSQVEKLVEVLEKKGIPLNIRRKIDILNITLIQNLLTILSYLNRAYKNPNEVEDLLFELMHYHFFEISNHDIAQLLLYNNGVAKNEEKTYLHQLIGNEKILKELKLKTGDKILDLSYLLGKWTSDIANVTLQVLFENIINEGKILQYILKGGDKTWKLQVLSTFFDLIKDEMTKKPDLKLNDFLLMIDKMKHNNLRLEINKIVHAESGINFLTAHSSKGLEFDRVIVPGVTKNIWDSTAKNFYQYSYPDNVNEDVVTNTEDERRLLYVAMTRARKELQISYSLEKENGKILGPSQFVDEIVGSTDLKISPQKVEAELVDEFQMYTMLKVNKKIELIDHDRIDEILQRYKLSVTGLNKYIKCPLTFYFETILQVPTARTKYMGFGRAIHRALEEYYSDINNGKEASEETLMKHFQFGMKGYKSHFTDEEFGNMLAYGLQILPKYYRERLQNENREINFGLEIRVDNAEYAGVPIKGVLDRVVVHKDHVTVVDYKTGNAFKYETKAKLKGPNIKDENGGDYWRQIVFYKILLDSDKKHNWSMTTGIMDFIEPESKTGEFYHQNYVVSPKDVELVGGQIKDVWDKIQNREFHQGCEKENCHWCNFVQNDYVHLGQTSIDIDE